MAPTIPTVAAGRVLTTNQTGTSATKTFPSLSSLTKNSGDLLIAICIAYQSTTTSAIFSSWGASFTEFHDSGGSSEMCVGMAYKWSDGSETGTFSVTMAGTLTGDASMILLSIPGAHASTPPEAGSRAVGTGSAADPASFDPSGWGSEENLWINVVGSGMTSGTGSWTGTGTTAPTNYTDRVDTNTTDDSTTGRVEAAVSFRQLLASSENQGPAGVDTSNARNVAVAVAVRGIPAVVEIPAWRWAIDDGNEAGHTWAAAENTAAEMVEDTDLHIMIRYEIQETAGGTDPNNFGWHLAWEKNESGSWNNVNDSGDTAATVMLDPSTNQTDQTNTTDRLTTSAEAFLGSGVVVEGTGGTGPRTGQGPGSSVLQNEHLEMMWVLKIEADDVAAGDRIRVRVHNSNTGGVETVVGGIGNPLIDVVSAAEEITPGGIASEEAFGTPSFTFGAVGITLTGIASEEAFGTATVSPGAVGITLTGIASEEAFGTPSFTFGAVAITPSGVASEEAFGTPSFTFGAVEISLTGIPSEEAFGTPTVEVGALTINAVGIDTEEAFGTPSFTFGAVAVSPSGIASEEAFGTPSVVAGAQEISPTGVASEEAFGSPSFTFGTVTVSPSGSASEEAFGTPSFTFGSVTVSPGGIASEEAFGTATFTFGTVTVSPTGIASEEAFGSPIVTIPGAGVHEPDRMLRGLGF